MFGGTPPAKPLDCKIRFLISGDATARSWAHHLGDQPMLVFAKFSLSPEDITWMSRSYSQIVRLSLIAIPTPLARENRKPCLRFRKQGEKNLFSLFKTCLPRFYPPYLRAAAQQAPRIVPGETHHPGYTGYDVSPSRLASSANWWLICLSKFSSHLRDDHDTSSVTRNLYFWQCHYYQFKYPNRLI